MHWHEHPRDPSSPYFRTLAATVLHTPFSVVTRRHATNLSIILSVGRLIIDLQQGIENCPFGVVGCVAK